LEGASTPQAEYVVEEALRHIAGVNSLVVVLIEIDDWEWKLSPLPEAERAELITGVFQAIEACYKERNSGYCIRDKDHGMALITGCGNDELQAAAGGIVAMVKVRFPVTITIGLGSRVQRGADLRSSYKQAKLALKEKLFLGKNQVIAHSSVKNPGGSTVTNEPIGVDLDGMCEAILRDMVNYRLVDVDYRLELLFLQVGKFREKATIIHFIVQFISRLHMHCQQMNENLYELLNWEYVHLNVMFQFETVHDMNSWLRRKLFELSERLYIKNQKQNRKIIDAIREYIDLQLASKITLKQVASHFSFSPNYLGQLFKEETGEHFSNYLIQVRIKRACELLLNPLLKVYEIADQMGYKNILYFHRQFKQLTGVTPGDYRKANKI
jgi:two-component system response regulator YesN